MAMKMRRDIVPLVNNMEALLYHIIELNSAEKALE